RAMAGRASPERSKRNAWKCMSIASIAGARDAEHSRFIIKLSLLDVHALQIGAHRPQGFLAEEVGHLRHVYAAIAHRAIDYPLLEPLITHGAQFQQTQIRGDTAGLGFQAVA